MAPSPCDLPLLQRWLTGWSRSRGVALPVPDGGGLRVEVGWPDQLRRHVFVDAGAALQTCAAAVHDPYIYVKAAVDCATLRRALPERWTIDVPRYLMRHSGPMAGRGILPAAYASTLTVEHGAYLIRVVDTSGVLAATGRITIDAGTAVYDRIETTEPHRRQGLASTVMLTLDQLATEAGITERLLVATEAGAGLYTSLGWHHLAPFSTALLPN